MKYTLGKYEMLKSKKAIAHLFEKGMVIKKYPLLMKYHIHEKESSDPELKFLFSVPKKNIKKAVTRITIKRRMRELARLNKSVFIKWKENNQKSIHVAWVFTGKEIQDYQSMEKKFMIILKEFMSKNIKENQ